MNFLFHLYLAGSDQEVMVGGMMGDFVKGRLESRYPPGINRGLVLHRRMDVFAERNGIFQQSRRRLPSQHRHIRGVLVDLAYDHFLALFWDRYCQRPLQDYLEDVAMYMKQRETLLPTPLRENLDYVLFQLIPSYRYLNGVASALERMDRRLRRPGRLSCGMEGIRAAYHGLHEDFLQFLPEAVDAARQTLTQMR